MLASSPYAAFHQIRLFTSQYPSVQVCAQSKTSSTRHHSFRGVPCLVLTDISCTHTEPTHITRTATASSLHSDGDRHSRSTPQTRRPMDVWKFCAQRFATFGIRFSLSPHQPKTSNPSNLSTGYPGTLCPSVALLFPFLSLSPPFLFSSAPRSVDFDPNPDPEMQQQRKMFPGEKHQRR